MGEAPYTLGTWKGLTTYKCPLCPFDCMDSAQAIEHYRAHSAKPPAPREESRPVTLALDDTGHLVVATPEPEPKPIPEPVETVTPVRKRRKSKKGV